METSGDQYINIALKDMESNVNRAISTADSGDVQRQTCPSRETLDRAAETKCQQYMQRTNDSTEIHSCTICATQLLLPECGFASLENCQGRARDGKSTIMEGQANDDKDVQNLTIVTMQNLLQRLKDKGAKNCLKDGDAKNCLNSEDVSRLTYDDAKICLNYDDAKNCLNNDDTKNCVRDEEVKNYLQGEDPNNCLKHEDVKTRLNHEGAKKCLKDEETKNCLEEEQTKNCLKDEESNNCLKDEDENNYQKLNDVVEDVQEEGTKDCWRLMHEGIFQKLQDDEVRTECQILDGLRDIHLSNVHILEQVGRSEPAVRRLLGRHTLTSKDVKDANVDEDIKTQVDTFLRTNVTGNLLVTRALRENYCTFQAWLTAHLQVERNAGVSRLRQALQMVDTEKRRTLAVTAVLSDVASTVQSLLQACSQTLPAATGNGLTERNVHVSHTVDVSRHGDSTCAAKPLHQHRDTAPADLLCDREYCSQAHNQRLHTICSVMGKYRQTSDSSCPTSDLSYKICHGQASMQDRCCRHGKSKRNLTERNHSQICCLSRGTTETDRGYSWIQADSEDKTGVTDRSTSKGICDLSVDEGIGWRSVIPDSLNRLSSVCERLISDHAACFTLLGLDPRHFLSLTEAVWASLQNRCQSSCWNNPGIDSRVEALEEENRNLLNELNVLKSRLADKNEEIVKLQYRLERFETVLKNGSCSSGSLCDTRGDPLKGNNREIPRTVSKPPGNMKKMCADLHGSSHPTNNSNTSTSANNGLYPVLKCSKIATSDTIVVCSKTAGRKRPRLTASEEECRSSDNSIRGATDKLRNQLTLRVRDTGLEKVRTEPGKIGLKESKEKAGLEKDTVTRVNGNSSTTSRASTKIVQEPTSSGHPLTVTQSSIQRTAGTAHQRAAALLPANRLQPIDRKKSLITQQIHATERRTDSLIVEKIQATGVQPAGLWTLSQIPSTHLVTDIHKVDGTMAPISESHQEQYGYTHSNETSSSEKSTVQCRSNKSEGKGEDKTSNRKSRRALRAGVVSLVSSAISDSTSMLARTGLPGKATVSKCMRCQELFSWADNHKLTCSCGSEALASAQKNDHQRSVARVFNQWRCRLQAENSHGCCSGQHV